MVCWDKTIIGRDTTIEIGDLRVQKKIEILRKISFKCFHFCCVWTLVINEVLLAYTFFLYLFI